MNDKSRLNLETVEKDMVQDSFVIGILVSKFNRKLKESLNDLNDLGEIYKKGQVGAFSLKGINRDTQMIRGYLYDEGIWKPSTFSMPDAIINRISLNRKWESFFRKTVGRRMMNNFTFNKWEMYKWLSINSNLSKYLPITRLVNSPQDIIDFLGQYNEGIIKPISGSYGKGIIKVSKHEENFKVEASRQQKQENPLYLNHEELEVYLNSKCKRRKYIVQQVINLYVGKSPIDFRLIMVKVGVGEWRDLGLIARKGSKNGIVSNIGIVKNGDSALQNLLSIRRYEAIETRKKMTQVSFDAAKEMEKYRGCNGDLGNLGIDLGIDRNQRLWIIEINHRNPRHQMAVDAGEDGIYFNSNKFIMDYVHKLAERRGALDEYLPQDCEED
ncbi:YheC/YheD family endospore coat-associated protein [Paenisporosarcina sp. TG-14]|uniref:YheC/YheD family endospore coat-associated protein n=1 Tax=Paenisporosarcina sp. TG-14 TaxID=1231057 RepID=UPI0002E7F2F0|nr:YheC/YheD family protein [Paenisporosarcina sp. TG-14]